jgi:hypothetical protein
VKWNVSFGSMTLGNAIRNFIASEKSPPSTIFGFDFLVFLLVVLNIVSCNRSTNFIVSNEKLKANPVQNPYENVILEN